MSSGTSASQVQQASQAFNAAQAKGDTAGMAAARASIGVNADGSGNLGSVTPSAVNYSGLIPSTTTTASRYSVTNPTTIANYQTLYNEAKAANDTATMTAAHNAANALRSSLGLSPGLDYNPVTGEAFTSKASTTSSSNTTGSGGNATGITPSAINYSSIIPSTPTTASKYSVANPTTIADYQKLYKEAEKVGDTVTMTAAHNAANALRSSLGLYPGLDYNPVTGEAFTSKATSLLNTSLLNSTPTITAPTVITTPTAATTPSLVPTSISEMASLLDAIWAEQREMEVPTYPGYQQREFQYTAPSYSITSNPADTSFIPTAKAKDRWLQQEQANADEAYKGYSSQYNAYQQGYNQLQNQIANALSLLPYSEMTAQQKVQLEYEQAQDAKKAELDKQAAEREEYWKQKDYELDQAKYDLSASKSSGGGSSSGGGGGSSGGNNNELYQDTIDSMLDGQARFRSAYQKSHGRTAPHSYNYYVNQAIALAKQQGQPLSQSQINALLQQANYMSTADAAWKKSTTSAAGIINQIGAKK